MGSSCLLGRYGASCLPASCLLTQMLAIMPKSHANDLQKISPEFATRLTQLEPQQKIRVIVVLKVTKTENPAQRQSRQERKAAMQALRESAEEAFNNIRVIIEKFNGKLLRESPDLLGSMPIEINAAGVNALAASDFVKAVIEDQAIYSGFRV